MTKPAQTNAQEPPEALFGRIVSILEEARGNVVRAVNSNMVWAYWLIGREIVEELQGGAERAEYGKKVIEELSVRLNERYGKGFSAKTLWSYRTFYQAYSQRLEILSPAGREFVTDQKLSPSGRELKNPEKLHPPGGELDSAQISYPVGTESSAPDEILKNPYVLEFLGYPSFAELRESEVEQAIITHLQHFLLELGTGFAFVARQKHIRIDEVDRFIDLVFYHCKLKFYLLIDLKIGKITHGDVGQMDGYVRMFDGLFTASDDNPTIGLILCTEKCETVARYSVLNDRKQIFASKYLPNLPSEEQLRLEIEKERRLIEAAMEERDREENDD